MSETILKFSLPVKCAINVSCATCRKLKEKPSHNFCSTSCSKHGIAVLCPSRTVCYDWEPKRKQVINNIVKCRHENKDWIIGGINENTKTKS